MRPEDITAVIVTRGNTDITPVLESLIFEHVEVWDNSLEPEDQMTYGRTIASVMRDTKPVIYSQDDDVIHSPENQRQILEQYQPGVLTGCMWPEWSQGAKTQGIPNGYDDLVFMGSGSVYDFDVPLHACARYLDHFPFDDFFKLWADTIIGILAPTHQLNIQFEALPEAEDDYRMCNLPDTVELKTEAIRRARWVRDEAVVAA